MGGSSPLWVQTVYPLQHRLSTILNNDAFQGFSLLSAQLMADSPIFQKKSEEHQTFNPRVVGSNPMSGGAVF